MARIQQDQFIDEDEEEEVCPLCVEEFDLGDRYFKPCPCGYQICQFCYNNIKTTMNGLCPACRRPYDDKPHSFKNVTQEELLQFEKNKLAQQKKRAAAKQKEAQKREADNLSRKHLAGLRVRQKNLVYVTGMRPKIQGDRVAELLRANDYFGQYGEIIKVVVSKSKDAAHTPNQPVGIYVTFARKEDAAACIEAINARAETGDGKIRAQHGTTKYCSAYLRGETCNNRNCMFLHEPGESAESFTRQDLSNMNAISTQQPSGPGESPPPQPPPQHAQPVAAAVQDTSPASPTAEGSSALPPGAGWARRGSRATSSSIESPVVTNTVPAQPSEPKTGEPSNAKLSKDVSSEASSSRPTSSASSTRKTRTPREPFDDLLKKAFNPTMCFNFSTKDLSEEQIKLLAILPPPWDPQGGAKRRLMKEREAAELARKQEEAQDALQDVAKPESTEQGEAERASGSLQLGGEPEERPDRAFAHQTAIQPPGFSLGPQFPLDNDLASLNIRGGSPAAQHQNQLLRQFQVAGGSQHQIGAHGRQPSRFSFNETGGIKAGTGLQQPKNLGGFTGTQQGGPFYSGVQGPPPGLKTTGTPPVNGSGMFGQGHGFTSGYAATRDADRAAWDGRTQLRGAQDAGKHELPALGQSIDPPRRATPTLPPGLFPNAENPPVAVPLPERVATPVTKAEEKPDPAPAIPEAPKEKAVKGDKGKKPAAAVPPAAPDESSVPRDPTPAESAASKRETKHAPKAALVRAATPTQTAAPETPVKAPRSAAEDVKSKAAASARSSPERKAEAPLSSPKRPHPGKLNLDTTPDASKVEHKENDSPAAPPSASSRADVQRLSRAPSVSVASIGSRPGTPLANVLATGSPLKRTVQPRTLVIRDTPKTETPPPLPAAATPASAATSTPPPFPSILPSVPSKIMSRRTSIASLNAPGTPVTERTDTMSITSTSASRANSPPPIVGKKARKKERAKKEKEAAVDAIVAAKEEAKEDVAPIMARKTKSRKKSAALKEGPVAVKEQKAVPPPVIKEEKGEDAAAAKKPSVPIETVASPVAPVEPIKAESAPKSKSKSATPVLPPASPPREEPKPQEKADASTSSLTAAVILQALDSTHQLALSTLNLLKPLTSQSELKKLGMDPFTSADLQNHIEQLRFELTKADEQLLKQGEAVRKDLGEQHTASRARVSGRCFVTPAGTRLSCLTKEEEEKYVEIEQRVLSEKGVSRWGGGGASHIDKTALKPKRRKLQSTLAQEDVLRALSIATESLEGALRHATKGTNMKVEVGPASVHLAGQGLPPPTTARDPHHPQDPLSDAREYVNKYVPRMLDANPPFVAVPAAEDDMLDDMHTGGANAGWNSQRRNYPVTHPSQLDYPASNLNLTPQQLADASLAAGMGSSLGAGAFDDLTLPPLPRHPTGSIPPGNLSQIAAENNTAAAMDTLKEAMATAGAIAKLGASEALKNPAELLKSWDKAMAGSSNPKNLQSALEKVVRDVGGVGKGKGGGGAMSVAELEVESAKERAQMARRETVEWEKKVNKMVRANRKLVLGNH